MVTNNNKEMFIFVLPEAYSWMIYFVGCGAVLLMLLFSSTSQFDDVIHVKN